MELEETLRRFAISPNASSDDVRERLRAVRNENHPDRTGGTFDTEQQEADFHKADEALRALEAIPGTSLAEIAKHQIELTERQSLVIAQISESQARLLKLEERTRSDEVERHARRDLAAYIAAPFRRLKFTSWGLAVVAATLVALKDPLREFSELLFVAGSNHQIYFSAILGGTALVATAVGVVAQAGEQAEVSRSQRILTEEGLIAFIHSGAFAKRLGRDEESEAFDDLFNAEDVARAIEEFANIADPGIRESVASTILEKLSTRGVIKPLPGAHLTPVYRLNDDLAYEAYRVLTGDRSEPVGRWRAPRFIVTALVRRPWR